MRSDPPPHRVALKLAAWARGGLPARAAGADHPLRLQRRGQELRLPAAGAHDAMVRRRLAARRRVGGDHGCRSRWRPWSARRSRSCWARWPRRRWRAPGSSAATRSRCCSILPIALPGIITGIALRSAYHTLEIPFSFWTIVIGHATFCVVVVFNNAVARLRRLQPEPDRGLDGPRRRRLPDRAPRGAAAARLGAAGRRAAGLRAELRRGDRHHLHRRPADHAADLDAAGADPPAPAAGDQRGGGGRSSR